MALLVVGRRRELDDAHVARVELGDEPLDRAALAGRIPALEDDADRQARARPRRSGRPASAAAARAGPAQPPAASPPPSSRATASQVDFGEAAHLRTSGIGPVAIVRRESPRPRCMIRTMPAIDGDRRARGLAPGADQEAGDHHDQEREQIRDRVGGCERAPRELSRRRALGTILPILRADAAQSPRRSPPWRRSATSRTSPRRSSPTSPRSSESRSSSRARRGSARPSSRRRSRARPAAS